MKSRLLLLSLAAFLSLTSCDKTGFNKWNLDKKQYHDFLSYNKEIISTPNFLVMGVCHNDQGYTVLGGQNSGVGENINCSLICIDSMGVFVKSLSVGCYFTPVIYKAVNSNSVFLLANDNSSGKVRIILKKFNSELTELWSRSFYINGYDYVGKSFKEDANGDLYICGVTNIYSTLKDMEPLIIKTNSNGEVPVWSGPIGSNYLDIADDIVVFPDSRMYITITEYQGTTPYTYIAKIDNTLNISWKRQITTGLGFIRAIAAKDGNIIIYGVDNTSFRIYKIDEAGNNIWTKTLNSSADYKGYGALIQTANGDIATLSSQLILNVFDKDGNLNLNYDYDGSATNTYFLCEPTDRGFVFVSYYLGKIYISKTMPDGIIKTD